MHTAANSYDAVRAVAAALRAGAATAQAAGQFLRTHEFDFAAHGRSGFDAIGGVTSCSFEMKEVGQDGLIEAQK